MAKFSNRLRTVMRMRKLNQAAMAELIEVAPGTLSAYLKDGEGKKVPTLDTLERIAKKLDVSVGWLCGEDPADKDIRTYSDLLGALVKICEANTEFPCEAFANIEPMGDSHTNYAGITTSDPTIVNFMVGYKKVSDLLKDETIDREMYDAWVEKKLKEYENHSIDGLSF